MRKQFRNVCRRFDSSLPRGDSHVTIFHAPVYERRKNIINRFRICKWLAAVVKHIREEIWQAPEWIFDYLYSALSGARVPLKIAQITGVIVVRRLSPSLPKVALPNERGGLL